MSQTVEVQLAFSFVCPACGRKTYVDPVIYEFAPDERSEVAEDIGVTPNTGDWLTHPEQVACDGCGHEYRALNPGESTES
jgi:rubredoxin